MDLAFKSSVHVLTNFLIATPGFSSNDDKYLLFGNWEYCCASKLSWATSTESVHEGRALISYMELILCYLFLYRSMY